MASPLLSNVRPADKRNYQTAKRASFWFRKAGLTGEANFTELGNLIDPAKRVVQELLEHYSNRRGQRSLDRTDLVSQKLELDFSVDELTIETLVRAFGGNDAGKSAGSVKVRDGAIYTNPGVLEEITLKMQGINGDDVVVRETKLEGTPTTYDVDPLTTDTADNTAGGDFNVLTNPLSIVAATYPGVVATVGALIKVEDEIMKVSAVGGGNITLERGALGTTIAMHANALDIYETAGTNDYVVDETNGKVYIILGSALAVPGDVPEVHVQYTKTVTTEKCALFDGITLRGEAQFQILTKNGSRLVWVLPDVEIRNNGDVAMGSGQDWLRIPLKVNVLADEDGDFGEVHLIDARQTTG